MTTDLVRKPCARAARRALPVLAALFLSGCCSGVSTDPREGGLAGGVCGKATHAYDQRLRHRQQQLASLSEAQRDLQARLGSDRRRAAALGTSVAAKKRRQDDQQRLAVQLDEQIAAEKAAIDGARAEKAAIEAEIIALDRKLAILIADADRQSRMLAAIQEGRVTAANKQQVDAQLSSLSERRAQVEDKIRRLRERLASP